MTTGSGALFKFPEFLGSTTYYTDTSVTVLKPKSPTATFKVKNCSVDMLLTTHHSCMQNRPCKEDYHQFIV